MSFYEEISKYYDVIFPVSKEKVDFITKFLANPPRKVLDIACGTGGYSLELAKKGYEVTAVDLDNKMVEELRGKSVKNNLNINVLEADMLKLNERLNCKYDLAFCIGNSLVHLEGKKEIRDFFKQIRRLLKEEGKLIIQIINYDRVLNKEIKFLPTIENNDMGLKFKRKYRYDKITNKILFKTILEVNGEKIENEIPLYPILEEDILNLLKDSGFNKVKLFGDFKGSVFDKDRSYPLVVVAY